MCPSHKFLFELEKGNKLLRIRSLCSWAYSSLKDLYLLLPHHSSIAQKPKLKTNFLIQIIILVDRCINFAIKLIQKTLKQGNETQDHKVKEENQEKNKVRDIQQISSKLTAGGQQK